MPRPSDITVKTQNDNFGPSQANVEDLKVTAPLDITSAASVKAGMLTKSLGIADQMFTKGNDFEQEKSDQKGQLDSAMGQVDPEQQAANAAYAHGAAKVSITNSGIQAVQEAEQLASTKWANLPLHDAPDKDGNNVPGLLTNMDAYFRSKLGGLESDPQAASILAPLISRSMNEAAGMRIKQQTEQTIQNGLDAAGAAAMRQADRQDGTFNWNDQVSTMTAVYHGDRHAAVAGLMHTLTDAMIQSHDPKFMDKIGLPDKITTEDGQTIDGPLHIAGYSEMVEVAKDKARSLQKQDQEVSVKKAGVDIADGILGGKNPMGALHQYATMPGADPHFIESMYDWWKNKDKQGVEDSLAGPAVTGIISDIMTNKLSTTEQIAKAANDARLPPKAMTKVMDMGLQVLRGTQSTQQDAPELREMAGYVSSYYQPGINKLTGQFNNPAAKLQQENAMLDFRTQYNQAIQQNKSPTQAAQEASQAVMGKYGKPIEQTDSALKKVPATDMDRGNVIRNAAKDPDGFMRSGINSKEIQRLRDSGYISTEEAAGAARLWLSQHPN